MTYDDWKARQPEDQGDDPDYCYVEANDPREARLHVHAPDDWPCDFVRKTAYAAIYRLPHGWDDEPLPQPETASQVAREAFLRGLPTPDETNGGK